MPAARPTANQILSASAVTGGNVSLTWATPVSGTVTSVGLSVPTGFSVSSSPVTSAGTLSLSYASGYALPTTASQTNWDGAYNDRITAASVTGTTTKTITLTQQDGGTVTATLSDLNTDAVTSVFGRTGSVTSTTGDYTTAQITESGNLYYTDLRARDAISLATTGSSGAATYDSTTGVLTIPNYTLTGLGGVGGSGTLNYLSKFTNAGTLTNSLLFDNGTNVGIGTITPTARLEIRGTGTTSATTALEVDNNSGNPLLVVKNDARVGIGTTSPKSALEILQGTSAFIRMVRSGSSADYGFEAGNNGMGLYDYTNNDYRWWVSPTGDVGIGTTSPRVKLHVADGSHGAFNSLHEVDLAIESATQARIGLFTPNSQAGLITFGDPQDHDIGRIVFEHSANRMYFTTSGGSGDLSITSTGNVGIGTGTITPTARLQVMGNNVATSNTLIVQDGSSNNLLTIRNDGYSTFGPIASSDNDVPVARFITDKFGRNNGIQLYAASTLTNTNGDYIAMYFEDNDKGAIQAADGTALRDLLLNPLGGNVGIGTLTPTAFFTIERSQNSYFPLALIRNTRTGVLASVSRLALQAEDFSQVSFFSQGSTDYTASPQGNISFDHTNNKLSFSASENRPITLLSSGGLDIGTDFASVPSGLRLDGIILHKPIDNMANYLRFSSGGAAWRMGIRPNDGAYPLVLNYSSTGSTASSPGGEILSITTTGNVGIGTTTIGSRLQVNGGAAIGYSASQAAPTNGLQVSGTILQGDAGRIVSAKNANLAHNSSITLTINESVNSGYIGTLYILNQSKNTNGKRTYAIYFVSDDDNGGSSTSELSGSSIIRNGGDGCSFSVNYSDGTKNLTITNKSNEITNMSAVFVGASTSF
jgi:hypothetical protein